MILNNWRKIAFITSIVLQSAYTQDFSYLGSYGPDHWGEQYTKCTGKQQSPINIDLVRAKNFSFPPLQITGFDEIPKSAILQNNGHTVVVTMDFFDNPTISGGPLNNTYQLAQFHFHWGDDDDRGSEDMINNQSFPVELHMVFFNKKYTEFDKALNYIDGLVVLAYFFQISKETNLAYVGLSLLLERIVNPDQPIRYSYVPKLEHLVSHNNKQYFTYTGSLTTPPCSEVVTWIDFETPIPITSEQIKNFRNLRTKHNELLTHNYRPIQPLNGRVVYRNVPNIVLSTTATTHLKTSDLSDLDISNNNSIGNNFTITSKNPNEVNRILKKNNSTKIFSASVYKYLILLFFFKYVMTMLNI